MITKRRDHESFRFSTSVAKLLTWSLKGTTVNVTTDAMSATVGINNSHKHKAFREKYKFATLVGNLHKMENDDGTEDPHHITLNFSKTANGKGDTAAAHYYPDIHTIKFSRADLEDIVLTKDQIAEAEAEVAANAMVFEDRKKGIHVVWHEGEWVRAA